MATIYYRIKARNSSGDSAPSNTDTVSIPYAPGSAPVNPTAVPPGTTTDELTLSWGLVPYATKYKIYRSTSQGFTPGAGNKLVAEPTIPPASDTVSLLPNVRYYYRLLAFGDGYDAPNYSAEFSGVTGIDRPQSFNASQDYGPCPTVVFNLSWSNANSGGNIRSEAAQISWHNGSTWTTLTPNASAGATTYVATVNSAVTQFRIKYLSESVYSTKNVPGSTCPE